MESETKNVKQRKDKLRKVKQRKDVQRKVKQRKDNRNSAKSQTKESALFLFFTAPLSASLFTRFQKEIGAKDDKKFWKTSCFNQAFQPFPA